MSAREQTVKLMHREARRNFLRDHVLKVRKATEIPYEDKVEAGDNSLDARTKAYDTEIQGLMKYLENVRNEKKETKAYIDLVLAEKIGEDSEGISTTMSKRFGQLAGCSAQNYPFVLLDNSGVRLVWKNKENAEYVAQALQNHGLSPAITEEGLLDFEVPESMKGLQEGSDRYQSKECTTIRIPHAQVEKLVTLAQYHPYHCRAVLAEWYKAREIDRPTLLGQEIRNNKVVQEQPTAKSPLYTTEALRLPFSKTQDLVYLNVAARPPQTSQIEEPHPHHVIILLDDSGSMNKNNKMQAANEALRGFLLKLSNDTLVTIQPFNKKTSAYRLPAEKIKADLDKYCSTPAGGGTPLCEILACSATFVRDPKDLIISIDELNRTTIALLTDGQPNGAAKEAIAAMQETRWSGGFNGASLFLNVIDVEGVNNENFVAYGLPGFGCKQLPPILPISIGPDSNQTFMSELAEALKVPEAFVSTDSGEQTKEGIDRAMALLKQMRGRVPVAFLGLSYKEAGRIKAVGCEEQNLFFNRGRDLFFLISNEAESLDSFTMIDGACERQALPQLEIINASSEQIDSILSRYAEQRLIELRLDFVTKVNELVDIKASPDKITTITHGRNTAPVKRETEDLTRKSPKELEQYAEEALESAIKAQKAVSTVESAIKAQKAVSTVDFKEAKKAFDETFQAAEKTVNAAQQILARAKPPTSILIPAKITQKVTSQAEQVGEIAGDVSKKYKNIAKQVAESGLDALKKDTTAKATQLQSICKETALLSDINLFVQNVDQVQLDENTILSQIKPGRDLIAKYTQVRSLGNPAPKQQPVLQEKSPADKIAELIEQGSYEAAWRELQSHPGLINSKTTSDGFAATPLITALVGLSKKKEDESLRKLIVDMLSLPGIKLELSDSSGNTALHRAAWYGEAGLSEAMIELAKKTNQLDDLKKIRNGIRTGATLGETVQDNIRHQGNTRLKSEDKIKLQKIMWTDKFSVTNEFLEEINKNPKCFNYHEPEFGNTPLMQLLRMIREAKTLQDRQCLRARVLELLNRHGKDIDFTESNLNGNTLLHFAIWYGEYEIACCIVDQAEKDITGVEDLLAARNTQGQAEITGAPGTISHVGGETPAMNLANKGGLDYKAFEEKREKARRPLSVFLMNAPELSKEKTFSELLEGILARLRMVEPVSDSEKAVIKKEELAISELLWAYNQLIYWQTLYGKIKEKLTPNQKLEFSHLSQAYGKELEGYSSMDFLQKSPLHELNQMITGCEDPSWKSSPAVSSLKKLLCRLREDASLKLVEKVMRVVDKQLDQKGKSTGGSTPHSKMADQKLLDFYRKVNQFLVNYQAYMTGKTATLNHLIEALCPTEPLIVEVSKQEKANDVSAYSF